MRISIKAPIVFVLAASYMVLSSIGCGSSGQQATGSHESGSSAPGPGSDASNENPSVRNVILMIGDGMGPQQVGFLQLFARYAPNSTYETGLTAFDRIADAGEVSISMTEPYDHLVVDSACSASQLATGHPGLSETIGLDENGDPVETILEYAESMGKATGLVTDTRITHATPAGFASHVAHRSLENDIAVQLLSSGVDVLLSAGIRHFVAAGMTSENSYAEVPYEFESRRDDDIDLIARARETGYDTAFDRDQLAASEADRILGLFANSAMMDSIADHATRGDAARAEPTLAEMARHALDVLSRNDEGFFLMIEGGQIDWAGHNNDAGRMLHELIRFEEAIDVVLDWVASRDDTLLVVTADHETGGFGFSYSKSEVPEPQAIGGEAFAERPYQPSFNFGHHEQLALLYNQQRSFFELLLDWQYGEDRSVGHLEQLVESATGIEITPEEATEIARDNENRWYVEGHYYLSAETTPAICDFPSFYVYGEGDRAAAISRVLADEYNATWSTGTHTHTPVPVFAYGPSALTEHFDRLLHHTEVGQLLFDAFGERE